MRSTRASAAGAVGAGAWSLLSLPALAHHGMDGDLPTTFLQGLVSGLAHPVIGLDHLAFIVAVGVAAAFMQGGSRLIAAFIAASTAGVLAHLGALTLPLSEVLVAGSVVVAGALVAFGQRAGSGVWLAVAVIAGLFHGYAFGEAIIGAERGVVGAYLMGLAIVSAAIAAGVAMLARSFLLASPQGVTRARLAGAAVGSVGVVMLVAGLVG